MMTELMLMHFNDDLASDVAQINTQWIEAI